MRKKYGIKLAFFLVVLIALMGLLVACKGTGEDDATPVALPSVGGISYNVAEHKIGWDAVSGAAEYAVAIDNAAPVLVSGLSYTYDAANKDFVVAVVAKGVSGESLDSPAKSRAIKFLAAVGNIELVDGVLHWDAVANATGYQLKINGVEQSELLATNAYDQIPAGASQAIFIKAVATDTDQTQFFSNYSNETIANLLTAPVFKEFHAATGTLVWDAVPSAAGYVLKLEKDGVVLENKTFGGEAANYQNAFAEAGSYKVHIKAVSKTDSNLNDSKYSVSKEIVRLPSISGDIITEVTNQNRVNVRFNDVEKATSFDVYVDNVLQTLTERNSFEYAFPTTAIEAIRTIRIRPMGDNAYVLNAREEREFQLTKLASPQNARISNEKITWDIVNKNTGYTVDIDGTEYTAQTNELNLPQISAGVHNIRVRARGNASSVVSSDFSLQLQVKKLAAPSGLDIVNNLLSWDAVTDAEGYTVQIDTALSNINATSYPISAGEIGANSVIMVRAKGNDSNMVDSEYSDAKSAYRLGVPTGLTADNDNVKWNPVTNATSYILTINSVNVTVTGTSYPTETLSDGEKLIRVAAYGDGAVYFESEKSGEISITKLKAPTLQKGGTAITWGAIPAANNGYEVLSEGTRHLKDMSEREFSPAFTTAGTKKVQVRAIGNGQSTVTSHWAEMDLVVSVEDAPTGDPQFVVTKVDGTDNKYKVQLTAAVDGKTYEFNCGGIAYPVTYDASAEAPQDYFVYTKNGAGTFAVKVRTKGDGLTTVDSIYTPTKNYTVLSAPTNIKLEYVDTDYYQIRWDNVNDAKGYTIQYTKTTVLGAEGEMTVNQLTTSLDIDTTDVVSIEIKIQAKGDGVSIFDSTFIVQVEVPRGGI